MSLQLVQRILLINYIGITVVGISTSLSSILSTLALTELGFQTAIVYYLYAPIQKKDEKKICSIITIYKTVYTFIGVLVFTLSLCSIPFIKYILKGTEITSTIVLYYLLLSLNSLITYFGAHRRSLLFADQKEYIVKLIDSILNLIFFAFKFLAIVHFKNYSLFLAMQILQTIISNVTIHFWVSNKYPYLIKSKFDFALFKNIMGSVKNVFIARFAGYVYGATDNLIISFVLGVKQVGLYSNYALIVTTIKNFINQIFNAMTSIIGNMLVIKEKNRKNSLEDNFMLYCHVRCIVASVIVVPWILFAYDLICILFGKTYVLDNMIVWLLGTDLYIHIVYSPCCEYISASGNFKQDKNIALIGMLINISVSLILVKPFGMNGVLFGTVISQIFFWIGRSFLVYHFILNAAWRQYLTYIFKSLWGIIQNVITLIIISLFKTFQRNDGGTISSFFIDVVVCEIFIGIVYFCMQSWTREGKMICKILIRLFKEKVLK